MGTIVLAAAAVLLGAAAGPGGSDIYHYTDADGRLHVTNIPSNPGVELVMPAPNAVPSGPQVSAHLRGVPFVEEVSRAALRHRLPVELLLAVIETESNFNPYAVSRAGARGLMQLMPGTARLMGVERIHDPGQNIEGGARYLRMMYDRFGRIDLALAAYNAGPEAVENHGRRIPPYRETINYVPKVMRIYQRNSNGRGPATEIAAAPSAAEAEASRPIYWYRDASGQVHISNMPR